MNITDPKIQNVIYLSDFVDDDISSICTVAAQLLDRYADHLKKTEPYATKSIKRLEDASSEISGLIDSFVAAGLIQEEA